jgi:RNA polymerase sigma-70 factor (ECF subfamily)
MLHRRYAGVLYDKCMRLLGDPSEAEDAVQETFVNAFRSLDSFRFGKSHLPWLYRIATNACFKIMRTRRRNEAALLEHPEQVDRPGRDPVHAIHVRRVIEKASGELDERGRQILVAHYLDGMDQGQIARGLGISRRAVVKRLTALRLRVEHLFSEVRDNG